MISFGSKKHQPENRDNIDASSWRSFIIIVKIRPDFSADRLINWASKKGLIEIIGIHQTNSGYARLLHNVLYKQEQHHFGEPEAEGDSEDIYDLLGF